MGSEVEGIMFVSSKRGRNEIKSSFVAARTNLPHSHSLTHEDGGTASADSEFVSSLTDYPFLTGLPEDQLTPSLFPL